MKKISVFTPNAMSHARNILRESEREENNVTHEDDSLNNSLARVYFEITSTEKNERDRFPAQIYDIELLEDTFGEEDQWVAGEEIEVVRKGNLVLRTGVLYEGTVIGQTEGTLVPIVSVAHMCCGDLQVSVSDGTELIGNYTVHYIDLNPRCSGSSIVYDRYWVVQWIVGGQLMLQVYPYDPFA